MKDPQIAAALRSGSPGALAELFDAYGDRLFRYCWCMLRNREIAQIALRDTLVVAQAHIASLSDPGSLGPWLYSLARIECRRRPAAAAAADETPARPSQPDADSRLIAWNAVMSMEADQLEALDLFCRHDVDLGLVLGLTADDARALVDRARQELERALGAEILVSRGSHACPDRAEVMAGWTGVMTPVIRERVLQHAAGCPVCGPKQPRNVSAARVFALLPSPALPTRRTARSP
jgi:DNA-directed RNA polymerase specialized sigma24 family protein